MRVLVVWEPVLATDWGSPNPTLTSMIPDHRAIQFWDHDRRLSQRMGGRDKLGGLALRERIGFRMKDVIWDTALLYRPGARWGAPADLLVAPVVRFREELAGALALR